MSTVNTNDISRNLNFIPPGFSVKVFHIPLLWYHCGTVPQAKSSQTFLQSFLQNCESSPDLFWLLYPGKVLRFLVLEMVMEGLNWSPWLGMPESWAAMSAAGFCDIAAAAFDRDLVSTFWTTFLHASITLPTPVLLHVEPASFITDFSCCTSLTRALKLLLLAGLPQTLSKASRSQLQLWTQLPQSVACCWAFW